MRSLLRMSYGHIIVAGRLRAYREVRRRTRIERIGLERLLKFVHKPLRQTARWRNLALALSMTFIFTLLTFQPGAEHLLVTKIASGHHFKSLRETVGNDMPHSSWDGRSGRFRYWQAVAFVAVRVLGVRRRFRARHLRGVTAFTIVERLSRESSSVHCSAFIL